jgi:NADH dehydrogenase (ubiquinone) 1 beta subcomplex subunit 9
LSSNAHKLYVKKLYRQSLRTCIDWYWRREEQREKQMMVRELFEANRFLTNVKEVEHCLGRTEQLLSVYQHPQPYIQINAPGGTKFERNLPFPEEVLIILN